MSNATTVAQYLEELPEDRRGAIEAVRKVIKKNLPRGYEEGVGYGMIGYTIPLSRYPDTYNKQPLILAALASQKNFMTLYLNCVYSDPGLLDWFQASWKKTGKKLDMGKSCVHFKKVEDVSLEVVGEAIARVPVDRYIASYEAGRAKARTGTRAKAKTR